MTRGRRPEMTDGLRADAVRRPNDSNEISVDSRVPGLAQMWLVILLNLGISVSLMVVLTVALKIADLPTSPVTIVWGEAIASLVAVSITLLIGKRWATRPWSEIFPFAGFSPALLPPLTLAAIGFTAVVSAISDAVQSLVPIPKWIEPLTKLYESAPGAAAISTVLIAPVVEEFLFRGYVLSGLIKRYAPLSAVALSALGFAVAHMNPWQFVPTYLMGLMLGWVRLRSGSLLPCLWLHLAFNGFVTGAFFLGLPGFGDKEHVHWALSAAGLGLTAFGLHWARRVLVPSLLRTSLRQR